MPLGRPKHYAPIHARPAATAPFLILLLALLFTPVTAAAETNITSEHRDTFGEIGMLDLPSARMAPDGELAMTVGGFDAGQRIALSFQALPWLEASFRYSRVPKLDGGHTLYDRSFGLKLRLLHETKYYPDVAIGIRDLIGTGIYSSEYIAASKRISDFDITAGLGWGRLAGNGTIRNPFGLVSKSFYKRSTSFAQGGTINLGEFFHGPDAGLFGGIVWHTPIDSLDLTVEYSGDRYVRESALGTITVRSPVNIGVSYVPFPGMSVTAGWFYGSTFGGTLSFFFDPTKPASPGKIGPPPTQPVLRKGYERAEALKLYVQHVTPQMLAAQARQAAVQRQRAAQERSATVSRLVNALGPDADVEIDGDTLLISMHASEQGASYCHSYAQLAARLSVNTVAVADLDSSDGAVSICAAPVAPAFASAIPATATFESPGTYQGESNSGSAIFGLPSANEIHDTEQSIRRDAAAQSLKVEAISIGTSEITVYYSNSNYNQEAEAIGRMVRILMADAPANIEAFHIVPVIFGQPVQDFRILRSPMERVFETRGTIDDIPEASAARPAPMSHPALDEAEAQSYPRFSWAITPALRQGLFDPHQPLRVQLYASLTGKVELMPGLSIDGEYQANLYDTFGNSSPPFSLLPHVRTDIVKYLTKGRYGVSKLEAVYRTRVAPTVFAEVKAGYLEDMYAGVGAQLLWRPQASRWAFGADVYKVWKRNFDRLYGLQDYTVVTGHVTVYYHSPWYGLNFAVHAGRYLAGDYGATIEISRRFLTDVEVGAYATFTNVPFKKFGEGSFDKGIFIRVPLEAILPFNTQSDYSTVLSSLTRDGGQRLVDDDSLFVETRRTSFDEIVEDRDKIVSP